MKKQQRGTAGIVREPPAESLTAARSRRAAVLAHADERLHSRSDGRLDARRVADRLGVPVKRLAPAVGYTPQGLFRNPTSEKLQAELAPIAFVLGSLKGLLDSDRSTSIWLRAPHPDLGGSTPLSFILSGRTAAVITLLHLAEAGQTS